jgi:FMN phosphatase YigB (HAD superfamily)
LSCRVGVPKRSEDLTMFQAVTHALRANKNECIFIDDREENIEKALRFGLLSIFFPSHKLFGAEYLRKIFENMRGLERLH